MIKILYVDDEPVLLDTLKLFLERDPEFQVSTALSGRDALDQLKTAAYDAVISDYEMPEIDGIELLKIIRAQYPRLPFIIFTGKGREEIVIESLNNGADYYVKKGGDIQSQFAELSSKVRNAVELRESQKKVARLNRLYVVLSRINEAVVRIHDRGQLMEEVAKIAVMEGGFIRAWIGFEETRTRQVSAFVASGTLDGFFTDVRRSTMQLPDRQGLTITAIREGEPSISNTILSDPLMVTWVEEAISSGYRSAASFPLYTGETTRGAMTFFSLESNFFTDTEIQLLKELAEDISYAIETLELETTRLKIQEALQHSEHRLSNIINFLPEPTFALDSTGTVIIWNQAMENLTGTSAEEVIGRGNFEHSLHILGERRPALLDLISATDEELAKHHYTSVQRNKHSLVAEAEVPRLRGEPAVLRLVASSLYDEKGQPVGAIESLHNITSMRKADRELEESREKYRLLLQNVNDAVVVYGISYQGPGKFIEVNDRACQMLGYTREELLTMNAPDIDIPEQRFRIPKIMEELSEKKYTLFQTDYLAKDRHRIPGEVSSRMFNLGGSPVILSVIRDISERRRTENALALAGKKLNLLSSITRHDILNQLTVLEGSLELAALEVQEQEVLEHLRRAQNASGTIQRQILFTREYEDLGVHEPEWQQVTNGIKNAFEQLHLDTVTLETPEEDPVEVYADPLLERVFYNLFDNAHVHGGNVTRITVTYQKGEDGLIIRIADNGNGIDPEDKKYLFERGYGKKTGLGLFLSREILGITGISIRETGEPGKGAQFEIMVPKDDYRTAP